MKTNTKIFSKQVQEHILSHFDDFTSLQNECKNYLKNFGYKWADTMVQYGCFDCYYSDVAKTMAKWFNYDDINALWVYYKNDCEKLWTIYKNLVCRELNNILKNKKVYIK